MRPRLLTLVEVPDRDDRSSLNGSIGVGLGLVVIVGYAIWFSGWLDREGDIESNVDVTSPTEPRARAAEDTSTTTSSVAEELQAHGDDLDDTFWWVLEIDGQEFSSPSTGLSFIGVDDPNVAVLLLDSGGPYPPACEASVVWHRGVAASLPSPPGTFRFDDCPPAVFELFADDTGLSVTVDDEGCLTLTRAGITLRASPSPYAGTVRQNPTLYPRMPDLGGRETEVARFDACRDETGA